MSIDIERERVRFVKAMRAKYSLPDRIDPFSFGWLTEKEFDIWLAAKRDADKVSP